MIDVSELGKRQAICPQENHLLDHKVMPMEEPGPEGDRGAREAEGHLGFLPGAKFVLFASGRRLKLTIRTLACVGDTFPISSRLSPGEKQECVPSISECLQEL